MSKNESSIPYINAELLLNKRDELESLITINKYDIVVIIGALPKNTVNVNVDETHKWVWNVQYSVQC